jgi:hypothetical protein
MRTLADALAKLHDLGGIAEDGRAQIRTMPLRLPNGEVSAIVAVIGTPQIGWQIAMPTSTHFYARGTLGGQQKYEISKLNGAVTDSDGNVQLQDGSYVHNVELEATRLSYQLTEIQQKAIHYALCFLKVEHRCYRYVYDNVAEGTLDFHEVAEVGKGRLPSLKAIVHYVTKKVTEVSPQAIAAILAESGLRHPRSGRRAV